jgi:uncharacterized protein YjiS (DUF1127 family)
MGTIDTISTAGRTYRETRLTGSAESKTAIGDFITRLVTLIETWQERRHSRIVLSKLTDRELADIGISRGQADYECGKPFWESSVNRMR